MRGEVIPEEHVEVHAGDSQQGGRGTGAVVGGEAAREERGFGEEIVV